MLQRWHALNDWLKALLLAFVVLGFLHVFVVRWVTVRSTSMYATLWPGDLVAVAKWPTWSGFSRGDIAVFRDPLQDDRLMARRQLLVKRIVGLPGDNLRLRDGALRVNDEAIAPYPQETRGWLVRLRAKADKSVAVADLGLPPMHDMPVGNVLELPLNDALAKSLRSREDVVSVEPLGPARGGHGHLFPFSPNFRWNTDDYGPITVPQRGITVRINIENLALYDRIITHYEGHKLEASGNDLLMDGKPLDAYTFAQDYYFVLGDSRHYSADSRYWGFVPADHLVGRAGFILLSSDPADGGVRSGRWFKGL